MFTPPGVAPPGLLGKVGEGLFSYKHAAPPELKPSIGEVAENMKIILVECLLLIVVLSACHSHSHPSGNQTITGLAMVDNIIP